MRYRQTCVCGSSIEVTGWGLRDFTDLDWWVKQHAHCVITWQREHGYQSRLVPTTDEEIEPE